MTTKDVGAEPASAETVEPAPKTGRIARLKAERERITTRVADTRENLSRRRSESEAIDTVFSVVERDARTGGPVLAGAVAFRIFLFQVPYVFTLVVGLGLASSAEGKDPSDLARSAGIGGITAQAISDVGNLSFWSRMLALLAGGFALFLAARSAVKVLYIIHALVWDEPVAKRRNLSRAAAVFIGIVTLAMALAALVGWLHNRSLVGGLLGSILFVLVPTAAWLLVSWFLPHRECPWWALLPGALLFGLGVEFLHLFTIYWIAHEVSTKSDRYGALGTALALLLWAYLLGRVIVASATLNAARWHIYAARHPREVSATVGDRNGR
jgi:uncharacterized BrkB/YihY/UPF0761 family membrane protein